MKDDALTESEADELFTTGILRRDLTAIGERAVRDKLNRGEYGQPGAGTFAAVSAWIADAEFARLAVSSAKRDAREASTLRIAKRANNIAIAAIIITAILSIMSIIAIVCH